MVPMYQQSRGGWLEKQKKKEMREDDMFYLLATTPDTGALAAFASFKYDFEDDTEVVYCYELQVAPAYRGQHVAQGLVRVLTRIGRQTRMKKIMLTCFKCTYMLRGGACVRFLLQ